jgi:hypothetical protein
VLENAEKSRENVVTLNLIIPNNSPTYSRSLRIWVYGPAEILRRRREAGYVWRFRTRSAVALVQMTDTPTTPASSYPDAVKPEGTEQADAAAAPLPTIRAQMRKLLDEEGIQKLIFLCQEADRRATEEEMLHFLKLRVAALRRCHGIPASRKAHRDSQA